MSAPKSRPLLPDGPPLADGTGPRRIHIVGGPGVGKTTLAGRLAAVTGLPVTHLDDIARVGGGDGPVRRPEQRDRLVAAILASGAWIVEGVHLGWTEPLLAGADLIVWLDTAAWQGAARGIARRFVLGAWHEVRTRPWPEKVTRLGDYSRQLRALAGALAGTRRYHAAPGAGVAPPPVAGVAPPPGAGVPDLQPSRAAETATLGSRAATEAALRAHAARVVHCRTAEDVRALVCRLAPSAPDRDVAIGVEG